MRVLLLTPRERSAAVGFLPLLLRTQRRSLPVLAALMVLLLVPLAPRGCVQCAFIAVLPMCASVQCVFRSTTYTVLTQTQDFVRSTERSRQKGHPSASHQPHTRRRPVRGSIADWVRRAVHRTLGRLASVIRVPRGGPILAIAARGTSPRKPVPQVISRSSSTSVTTGWAVRSPTELYCGLD